MAYTPQELKNLATQLFAENHMRNIDGVVLQQFVHDMIDTMVEQDSGGGSGSGDNYYVDSMAFDPATNILTLGRAGGIVPANISKAITPTNPTVYRAGEQAIGIGDNPIAFSVALPVGTNYIIFAKCTSDEDGADIGFVISQKTVNGFSVNVDEAATIKWFIIQTQ